MLRTLKNHHQKAGLAPGLLVPQHLPEKIDVRFQKTILSEEAFAHEEVSADAVDPGRCTSGSVTWFRVIGGVHDPDLIQQLGDRFKLHRLVLEDIMNLGHRPKLELHDAFIFIVMKNLTRHSETVKAVPEQVTLLMGEGWVLSFEEREATTWGNVLERMRQNHTAFTQRGVEYTVYALLDALVDNAFGLLDQFDAQLDSIEGELRRKIQSPTLMVAYEIRRELILLRRYITPMRDLVGQLVRGEATQVRAETRLYMRDVLDHLDQLLDATQIFSEMAESMVATHLSASSQKSTEVMQTLTIIATIFIPLTFIAGVYGMNFEIMPELGWKWSYPLMWLIFVTVTGVMLRFFRKRKWI